MVVIIWPGRLGVVEEVGVDDLLVRHQFQVLAAKGVRVAAGEVGELHAVDAADARVHLQHAAGEAVRRQELGHRVGVEESAVDALGRRLEDAVEADGAGAHGCAPWSGCR
jgi:hypothetical protein